MTTPKLRLFGAAATLALLAACSASSESQRTSAPEAPTVETAAQNPTALPGRLGILNQALSKLTLKPEQKTEIDKLLSEAAVRHQAVAQARTALKNAVATQLESGTFNRVALSSEVTALETAANQTAPADRAGLVRLHAILDPTQRNQLVDTFLELSRSAKTEGGHGKRGGRGMFKAREWAQDLSLTDEQIDQIKGAMREKFQADRDGKRADRPRRGMGPKRLAEAFRSDTFTLDQAAFSGARQAKGASRMLDVLEVAAPTLTAEQRQRAAEKLRATEF